MQTIELLIAGYKKNTEANNTIIVKKKIKVINSGKFKEKEVQSKYEEATNYKLNLPIDNLNESNNLLVDFLRDRCKEHVGIRERTQSNIKKIPKRILQLSINISRLKNALASFSFAYNGRIITKAMLSLNFNRKDFRVDIPIEQEEWQKWKREVKLKLDKAYRELKKITRKFENDRIRKAVNKMLELEKKNPKVFNRKLNWKKLGQNNFISKLIKEEDIVINDQEEIKEELSNFWKDIFSSKIIDKVSNNQEWFKTKFITKTRQILINDESLMKEVKR